MQLDRVDYQILDLLQKQGNLSNLELAERVSLSPSPCSRRVKALQELGLIVSYKAILDAKRLGLDLMALIQISMDRHIPERFESFEAEIANYPEVLECYLMTGQSADYVLKVLVKDMHAYQEFLLGRLTRINGVTGVHSSFVMRRVVDHTHIPLTQAMHKGKK